MAENKLVFDKTLSFDCGCSFPYCETPDGKRHVDLSLRWEDLRMDCPATFKVLESGRSKGCFQIESNLGQQTCKDAPINNIDDIGYVITIMRPGSTESFLDDGKNTTYHYLARKAGREPVTYLHPSLEPHLKETYGLMLTQEQMMFIVKDLAGFTGEQADTARKGIAKKKADIVAKVKVDFLDGCKKINKVSEEEANKIWSWIEAGQRYSFNLSHAVQYAYITYFTAYAKAHFESPFFTAWLEMSGDKNKSKQKEIRELIRDAKKSNIEIQTPSFIYPESSFSTLNDVIRYGICDIKGVGESSYKEVHEVRQKLIQQLGDIRTWSYLDHQFLLFPELKSQLKEGLIKVGGFSYINRNRLETWYEASIVDQLTDALYKLCVEHYKKCTSVLTTLEYVFSNCKLTKPQSKKLETLIKSLKEPPYSLQDTIRSVSDDERYFLGIAITCNSVEECDISAASHTVKDIYMLTPGFEKFFTVGVEIDEVKEYTIKNGPNKGQKMGILVVSDNTCTVDGIAVFGKTWSENKSILVEGNTVMIGGKITQYKKSMVVEKVWQL